ncbi:divisome protein SepX/GlpR [Actinoplanes derwentensis]|uniref:Uncharacterized protein n=1 Tax=Actinoplanes derwentensis TaxID=113562 RepID=A0A1H2D0W8_9ACTN|nr:hypothetical protein [Actinoplanes derwentensis]GID85869.1 hypothetical protein Ade03nite_47930 [Actinoplanes derwentensis]SDT76207.1 hypothetical protein SAMN04489716_7546 [Actinoplanes derwentensis]
MPTSVLLAVLAAAGLLALAPALVRRYDATERLAAERASSTARVLQRQRRRRTVPGRRPINPARQVTVTVPAPTGDPAAPPERRLRLVTGRRSQRVDKRRGTPAVVRRRRVFAALILLNTIELIGVVAVGPGFWIGFAVTGSLLGLYLVHLRNRAIIDRRRRRVQAREAAWLAARQAEVRREQARRAAARREAQRRLAAQREAVRRAAMGLDREPTDLPAAANGGSVSYRRRGGLRGRAYEAGGRHHNAS